ncbi:MAG TPA: crotonase/enoyl-CoA hydratase family protein [Acidimicrobiales bacterium]|nr:crotonase/enoyl-CoA hydratase family protein [Acidimicrobiales bacterium]
MSVEMSGHVADVRLNRPDKMNALDPAMFAAIVEAGEALKADPSVRAVVLSGEGRAFCAGLDFGSFQAMAGAGDGGGAGAGGDTAPPADGAAAQGDTSSIGRMEEGRLTHRGQQSAWVWQELEVPVIAAIHGVALGGGCQIALGADIRIIAPDARMSVLEIRWGLTPDMTGTVSLVSLVGLDVAKELTFTGRMVEGEEAVRLGLATRVSEDPRGDALALAAEIAGKSPQAIRGAKRLLNQAGRAGLAQQLADERKVIGSLIGRPDQAEAVRAFFEKRDPVFQD